jgi:DNA-binding response OmpR family regulator
MRVLLVDDEPSLLFAIRDFLTSEGFQVECATEREEAQALLLNITFDVAVTDLRLTPLNPVEGLQLASFIRERVLPTRVIVLTAVASPEAEAEAKRIGVDAYLRKPASLRGLATLIRGNAAEAIA